jgi:anaerobic magnesium-protoporphyrin IX monomethyl ester cyclase
MKLQLVQPTTGEYNSNSRSGCYVPLGLVSIATYVQSQRPGVEVEILDGEHLTALQIEERLDGDVVGINANTVTYPQALEVARVAKGRGARVLLGGVYPSAIPELILRHRGHLVDTVVVGYGEIPTVAALDGPLSPLVVNHQPPFPHLPAPDRRLVQLERYLDRFQDQHPTWPYRGTNVFTNVGCLWRERSAGGCIFCSRSGTITAFRPPEQVWREVRTLVDLWGVDYLVDFSDTSLQNLTWFESLIRAKPADLSPQWHIFARMDEITAEALSLAKQLPCDHIFVGVESGDPAGYRAARKGGGSPEQMLEVARLLRRYDISITPSYVVGLPGEDRISLEATLEHARRLQEITRFEEIFCCPLIPFPGSLSFSQLQENLGLEEDLYDIEELKLLWARLFCKVDIETLSEYAERILELGRYKITIQRLPGRQNREASENRKLSSSAFGIHSEGTGEEVYTCA